MADPTTPPAPPAQPTAPAKTPIYKKWWLWAIVAVIIVALATRGKKNDNADATKPTTTQQSTSTEKAAEPPPQKASGPEATMREFNQVKTGMSVAQVDRIFGGPGEVQMESGEGQYHMIVKTYKAENKIANATVTFMNGKVQGKAQVGLE